MGMKTVAIIGALDEEVALIAKSLTHVTHTAKGSLDIVSVSYTHLTQPTT